VFREVGDNFHLENVREVTDPTLRFVPEVAQTFLEFRSISPTKIKDIAFVFKTSFLLDLPQYHVVQGISNVYQPAAIPQRQFDYSRRQMPGLPIMLRVIQLVVS
jgi:hypothetical protein